MVQTTCEEDMATEGKGKRELLSEIEKIGQD